METQIFIPSSQKALTFEPWEHKISETFSQFGFSFPENRTSFSGSVVSTQLDNTRISSISTSPISVRRHRSHINGDTEEFFILKIQNTGKCLSQHRHKEEALCAGDFALYSSSDPSEMHFPAPYKQTVISIPKNLLSGLIYEPEDFLGKRLNSQNPTNTLFVTFAQTLCELAPQVSRETVSRLENHMLDLLVTALQSNRTNVSGRMNADQRVRQIKQYINAHLYNPDLTPDKIAKGVGASKRNLHLLFKDEDITLARYIQLQRLKASKYCLENEKYNHLSISQIALDHGFSDSSHFSRAYKEQFGHPPSQARVMNKNTCRPSQCLEPVNLKSIYEHRK